MYKKANRGRVPIRLLAKKGRTPSGSGVKEHILVVSKRLFLTAKHL